MPPVPCALWVLTSPCPRCFKIQRLMRHDDGVGRVAGLLSEKCRMPVRAANSGSYQCPSVFIRGPLFLPSVPRWFETF
jgi:hypothetical protein